MVLFHQSCKLSITPRRTENNCPHPMSLNLFSRRYFYASDSIDRFMRQVAASKGSVYLHLDNGETCDLKKDSATTELFQMMNAPAKGFSISVADPADVTGFLHYMLEAGRKDRAC